MTNTSVKRGNTFEIHETRNVGHAKYVVSYHTGKKHADGSDFYDIRIFKNQKVKDRFVRLLKTQRTGVSA